VQQNNGQLIQERKARAVTLIDTQEVLKTGAVCRSSQTQWWKLKSLLYGRPRRAGRMQLITQGSATVFRLHRCGRWVHCFDSAPTDSFKTPYQ